ncbi:DUF4303 domain-containing protein [Mycetocola manganoxydans]|uniref:DUF4303 domain-containing protein n=1 Tax=Mycetocola manganoxydans TaxID=699879 RepID=A0A3L6ZV45_9MICO|nr:DUF4303 domain-containing protein [Mycetocola manganoxydans]RLP71699.1 DUF4303 domain-containing protein [Mycetocola manganoxydans]GHD39116.1 hypothetical protein GCM10008097_01450 [Mycetocola manganoxydans]
MNWNLETWGDDLTVRLRNALASNFQLLTADLDPADVVGVGAYTDADATNVVAAVHTRDHYRAALERRPQYANYFLWSIGEWDLRFFEHLDEDALQSVNSELLTRSRDASIAPARDVYRTTVWNAVVRALSEVVDNDLDAYFAGAVRAFEPIDADVAEAEIRGWTAQLNGPELMVKYDAWVANPSS